MRKKKDDLVEYFVSSLFNREDSSHPFQSALYVSFSEIYFYTCKFLFRKKHYKKMHLWQQFLLQCLNMDNLKVAIKRDPGQERAVVQWIQVRNSNVPLFAGYIYI